MSTATTEFNATEYIKNANEREAASRNPPVLAEVKPKTVEVVTAKPDETTVEGQTPKLPSSVRRELNRLRVQLGEAQGELKVLREMKAPAGAETKVEPKPEEVAGEPTRDKFPAGAQGDADFTKAIAKYTTEQTNALRDQQASTAQRINDMAAKFKEDVKLIPDFEAHAKEAEENGPEINWSAPENYQFSMLLVTSEYQALALDYYATHPDEFEEIVALKGAKQIEEFRALEGHLKRVYSNLRKAAKESAGKQTTEEKPKREEKPAEPARRLPAPSESVAARGGSSPPTEVSPYLADGKTINPAWKEMRNAKERNR